MKCGVFVCFFFFSSRRRHTCFDCDWSSDVCSSDLFRQVRGKIATEFVDGGEQALKNLARPVRIYRAQLASAPVSSVPAAAALPLPGKPSIAVLPFQNMSGDPE